MSKVTATGSFPEHPVDGAAVYCEQAGIAPASAAADNMCIGFIVSPRILD